MRDGFPRAGRLDDSAYQGLSNTHSESVKILRDKDDSLERYVSDVSSYNGYHDDLLVFLNLEVAPL